MNSATKKIIQEEQKHENQKVDLFNRVLFHPEQKKIGCSKEYKCSHTSEEKEGQPEGQSVEFYGACLLGPKRNGYEFQNPNIPEKNGLPDASKYGDLLGLGESSGGINFNFAVFLGILAFYF